MHVFNGIPPILSVGLLASALLWSPPALAALCGDDVDGSRVACSCGDTVVSGTRLRPTDPVVSIRCEGDGLTLLAPSRTSGLRVDFEGLTLRGSGIGVGLRVVRGGESGAIVTGGRGGAFAVISGFDTGMKVHGSGQVREIRSVTLVGNRRDGLRARMEGGVLADVRAEHNGRDGIRVDVDGTLLRRLEASNNGNEDLKFSGHDGADSDDASAGANGGSL